MYGVMLLVGVAVSAIIWTRMARQDPRLPVIYLLALVCAFVGAKLAYLVAEGWKDWGQPDLLWRWATGKSILGGLLFGYAGVELGKKWLGYSEPTGDRFAMVVPIGIALGRIGCLFHGCCQGRVCPTSWYTVTDATGKARWPAAQAELIFNLGILLVLVALRRVTVFRGQLFHLYLIAYGAFRFVHEFARDTPRVGSGLTGYQGVALTLVAFGLFRFRQRAIEWRRNPRVTRDTLVP